MCKDLGTRPATGWACSCDRFTVTHSSTTLNTAALPSAGNCEGELYSYQNIDFVVDTVVASVSVTFVKGCKQLGGV